MCGSVNEEVCHFTARITRSQLMAKQKKNCDFSIEVEIYILCAVVLNIKLKAKF